MKCPEPIQLLIFTDWYLPGYQAGGPIVSIVNLAKALSTELRIGIVCRDRDYLATYAYPNIAANSWCRRPEAWVYYLSPDRSGYKDVAAILRSNDAGVLYVNGMFSKSFSIFPLLAAQRSKQRIVLAPRGMLAPGAMGIKPFRKRVYLALAKMLGLYKGIELHATHSHEAAHIRSHLGSKVPVKVVPNIPGIPDHNRFSSNVKTKVKGELNVLMVARLAREKNTQFALECLIELAEHRQIRFTHIGPVYDQAYAMQCRQLAEKGGLDVQWLGALPPSEIGKHYGDTHLFFLPSLGENFGHAIAEALLHGVPVLTSDQTPWRSMEKKGWGADFSLADRKRFVDYLDELANLDAHTFRDKTGGIAEAVEKAMGVKDLKTSYVKYFSVGMRSDDELQSKG